MLMLEVFFKDSNTGFLTGSDQSILYTSNAGLNWQRVLYLSSLINLHSVNFIGTIGYACGSSGRIFKTSNGGLNWFQQAVGLTNREFYSVSFGNSNVGYAVGIFGNIYYTSNGGADWILQNSTTGNELRAIHAFDSADAIVIGYGGNILKTTTGGQYIGVKNIQTSHPKHFKFYNNYPNPFNPSTKIKFEIAIESLFL